MIAMTARERVFRVLDFQQADRVPVDLWMSTGFQQKLTRQLGIAVSQFLDQYDIDFRYIPGPRYIGPPLEEAGGFARDIWGVWRQAVTVGDAASGSETYREAVNPPLADAAAPEQVDAYPHWPSPDWYDYSEIESQCDEVLQQDKVCVFMGDRLNRIAQLKPAMYLCGIEKIFLDMALRPEVADAVFERIRRFYYAYEERILEAAAGKLDMLLTGDDFGSQNGPLVSNAMWERFLGDGFAQYTALAKSYGVKVMHHTCGGVYPLIPLLIDRGLDILQSLQPEVVDMQPEQLKQAYGTTLAFHGGISIQQTLPFGSPEQIRAEVKKVVETLAPGGGYIFGTSHNIQADTPVENVQALLAAYQEFGAY